jgi:hypothetical protein
MNLFKTYLEIFGTVLRLQFFENGHADEEGELSVWDVGRSEFVINP